MGGKEWELYYGWWRVIRPRIYMSYCWWTGSPCVAWGWGGVGNWCFRRNTETVAHNGLGTGRIEVGESSEEVVCNRELLHYLKVWTPIRAAILTPNEAHSSQQGNIFIMAPKKSSFILCTSHYKVIHRLVSSEMNLILIPIPLLSACPCCSEVLKGWFEGSYFLLGVIK